MPSAPRKAIVTPEHRQEAKRLKEIYVRVGPSSQAEFGRINEIGGQTMVANYLNGHSPLNLAAAVGFARGLGCSIRDFSRRLAREAQAAAEASGLMSDMAFIPIPRLTVSAGAGPGRVNSVVEEDGSLQFRSEFLQSISVRPQNAAIITIRGGSMEPTIKNGAVVLINRGDTTPREGNIYAFVSGDELLVKRFLRRDDHWIAASDNGDPEIKLDGRSWPAIVQGRVVWMGAKL